MSDKKIKTKLIKNGPEKEPLSFNKQTIFAGVAVVISIALFFVNNKFKCVFFQSSHNSSCEVFMSNAPKYCVYVHNNGNYILESLEKVVNLLGLERVEFLNGSEINEECDLFWTYNYPFVLNFTFKNLKYYQRLNHIPGNVGLASKSILGTTTNSKYIPKAFKNSADLQKYAEKYPEKRFVQKMRTNRGVELKKASEMNFTTSETDSKYFGQEFIENPLLFEGHKFDMGVFVVITSVNPLRFYYYNDNLNIRLCSRPYDYNNFDDLRTYVIDDAHITGGHFKTIKEYYDKSYSYKAAFNDYFTSKGYDMNKVWNQVEDCIRSVVVSRNKYFMDGLKKYKSKYSFFEMYRFDMILDDVLNLYLLEVNQSPNIYAAENRVGNRQMFNHMLYNMINLIGTESPLKRKSIKTMSFEIGNMMNNPRSLSVLVEVCMNAPCNESCKSTKCELCRDCMTQNQKIDTIIASQEQKNHGAFKRLFPVSDFNNLGSINFERLSPADKLHSKWFKEMCKVNKDFC